jgi:hypothetical protein
VRYCGFPDFPMRRRPESGKQSNPSAQAEPTFQGAPISHPAGRSATRVVTLALNTSFLLPEQGA